MPRLTMWLEAYLHLLASSLEQPSAGIRACSLLTQERNRAMVAASAGPRMKYDRNVLVSHLIQDQASRIPQNSAVEAGTASLSYGSLQRRVEACALSLQAKGITRGQRVALCFERSPDMLVGCLGVLYAGAAYIPLDPAAPIDRISSLCRDAEPAIILAQESLLEKLEPLDVPTVCLDSEENSSDRVAALAPEPQPEDPAYIMYTSGSTGHPKGVVVQHRHLLHSTQARARFYRQKPDRFLLLSAYTFDSSVAGIYWTLSQGGTLILPPPGVEHDPQQLAQLIAREDITHMLALPSLYRAILEQKAGFDWSSLETVIVAGEVCPLALIHQHALDLPNVPIYNEYGPTEATVWCTSYRCKPSLDGAVPIGRAIPNTEVYVLGPGGQLAPIGTPGEICIAGDGVSAGYLNQGAASSAVFIPNPFFPESDTKLYHTGDRGVYQENGELFFLGRADNQVKVRGYRIELEEIEHVLLQHPGIDAAAIAKKGEEQLVGYIACKAESQPTPHELHEWLLGKLPEFMIPSGFMLVDSLPLNDHGKLDRRKLPTFELSRAKANESTTARHSLDALLMVVWGELLKLDTVGLNDHFFELGGHSILVTHAAYRLRELLSKTVPLSLLFEYPILASFADELLAGEPQPTTLLETAQAVLEALRTTD